MNPDSLVAQVFRARYYPNGSFLEAGTGYRPSAVWTSIIRGRHIINKDLRIRIGNGFSTNIWSSPWIPDDNRFKVYTQRHPDAVFPLHVSDLVDPLTGSWNVQLLEEHFWPIDRECILSIHVGSIYSHDRVVWHFARDGKFSVKTAYHVAMRSRRREGGRELGEVSGDATDVWQNIWSLNLPPKVKMFLWRSCKNILPLGVELYPLGIRFAHTVKQQPRLLSMCL